MTKLVNRAKMTTATTGTGTLTLGSAVDGYQTFANAGVANADVVRYVIEDGDAWEIGLGTYTASGTTLTRGSIESSNADAALNLTGNAVVFVTTAAGDLQELVDFADNFTLPTADGSTGQVLTTNGAGTLSFTTIEGYTDADVDTHLNTSTASSGEVLSWTGTDYDWAAYVSDATFDTYITSAALSGTTPSVDVGARDTYTLTTSGNTTFTFTGAPSTGQVGTFSLIITAGGTHTLTWPASVLWAGGSAPDAPASTETQVYTFFTVNGGTAYYGFLAGDAMA
jgi:hypothetical protein